MKGKGRISRALIRATTRVSPPRDPSKGLSDREWRRLRKFAAELKMGGRVDLDPGLFRAMVAEIAKSREH